MAGAQHSSENNEWYTPRNIVAAAHQTMGGIDLDPASCAVANTVVRARHFFDEPMNGLQQRWGGRVFLNPPGGVTAQNRSRQGVWWRALALRYGWGHLHSAIFIGFSIEILQTAQGDEHEDETSPLDFPICVPRTRPKYLRPVDGELVEERQPTHAGVVVFLPPRDPAVRDEYVERFVRAYTPIGKVANHGLTPRPSS